MPNVPNVPGVPALSSYAESPIALLVSDIVSLLSGAGPPIWGVYLNGEPAFTANSTVSFEFKQNVVIPTYLIEGGGFQNYDRVQLPFDVTVTLTSGGTESERQALLNEVAAAYGTLNLYDIVTPEFVYSSCSLERWEYRRTSTNGVGMIVVDIWFKEIRFGATATYQNTQQPGVAGQQGIGNAQPMTPNQTVQQEFDAAGVQ